MSSRSRLLPDGDREANHNRGPWRLPEGNRVEIGTKAHKGEEIVSDREDWLLCNMFHRERESVERKRERRKKSGDTFAFYFKFLQR